MGSIPANKPQFIMVHGAAMSNKMGRPHRAWLNVADIVSIEETINQTAIDPDRIEWIKGTSVILRDVHSLEVREPFEALCGEIQLIQADGDMTFVYGPYRKAMNEWAEIVAQSNGNPYVLADNVVNDAEDDETLCNNPTHDHGSFGNLPARSPMLPSMQDLQALAKSLGLPEGLPMFSGTPDEVRAQMVAAGLPPELINQVLEQVQRRMDGEHGGDEG